MTPLFEMIIAFPLLGLIPAFVARRKGYDFLPWWMFGTVLGVIAAPIAIFALRRKWPVPVVLDHSGNDDAYAMTQRPKVYAKSYENAM